MKNSQNKTNSSNQTNQNSQNEQSQNYTNKQNKSEKNCSKEALSIRKGPLYLIYLFAEHFAEAHEDRRPRRGGVRCGRSWPFEPRIRIPADGPLHRVDGPRTDVGSVRKLRQIPQKA